MIKGFLLLTIIYLFSMLYNYFIKYLLLLYISNNLYNNIIISIIILVQIDNFIIYTDYIKNKLELENLLKEININKLKPPKIYKRRRIMLN
jgi:hypothetical protein